MFLDVKAKEMSTNLEVNFLEVIDTAKEVMAFPKG